MNKTLYVVLTGILLSHSFSNESFAISSEKNRNVSEMPSIHEHISREEKTASSTGNLQKACTSLQKNSTVKFSYADIQALRKAGKLEDAKLRALCYLQKYPKDVDVILQLGFIYTTQKEYKRAQDSFAKVLRLMPTYMDARIGLIRIKMATGQSAEAETLIKEGLAQNPEQQQLLTFRKNLAQKPVQQALAVKTEDKPSFDFATFLNEIKTLKKEGKLRIAEEKAVPHLKKYPQDSDVEYLLALIYLQQKRYDKAEIRLKSVLAHTPDYTDARIRLVKLKMFQKKFKEADALLTQGLIKTPGNEKLKSLQKKLVHTQSLPASGKAHRQAPVIVTADMRRKKQAEQYLQEKKFARAEALFKYLVKQHPYNTAYRIALADFYLSRENDMAALIVIREGLQHNPSNIKLLLKEGEIHTVLHQYALAADSYQRVLTCSPDNKAARGYLDGLDDISPYYRNGLNELGFYTDNAYVSDLHSVWDYSSLYYARDMGAGRIAGKINTATRYHQTAEQYELNVSPRFTRNIYGDFAIAFGSDPALFPDFMTAAEGFIYFPGIFELSGGSKYSKISQTYFSTYTGSLSVYPGNFWLSFRPYFFLPKNHESHSILYTLSGRRYFSTVDHFISVTLGTGRSPDLSDLLTVNFIVIQNNFANVGYTFPILDHRILINLGAGYQHWRYPSDLIRRLYDGTVGFKFRF